LLIPRQEKLVNLQQDMAVFLKEIQNPVQAQSVGTSWRLISAFWRTQKGNSMADLLSLEVENVDPGVGAPVVGVGAPVAGVGDPVAGVGDPVAGVEAPVAGAATVLHAKFCKGRENWGRALMMMLHLLRYDACDEDGGGGIFSCCFNSQK
jgi:hypothetical protein